MQTREKEKMENSSELEPYIMSTEYADGSADFTISVDDEDYKFSAFVGRDSKNATLSYEETLTFRGTIRVKEPREEVFKLVMQSEEMTEYLESNNLTGVRRDK